MMGDMAAAVKNPCVGCGEPAETHNDAIGYFGGFIHTAFCELCDEINNLLWDFATIRLQARLMVCDLKPALEVA